eukprot:scaffold1535_cov382-Prasinococcus_capsulatus_cf.AAC.22
MACEAATCQQPVRMGAGRTTTTPRRAQYWTRPCGLRRSRRTATAAGLARSLALVLRSIPSSWAHRRRAARMRQQVALLPYLWRGVGAHLSGRLGCSLASTTRREARDDALQAAHLWCDPAHHVLRQGTCKADH